MIVHCVPFVLKRIDMAAIRAEPDGGTELHDKEGGTYRQAPTDFLQVAGPCEDGSYILLGGYSRFYSLQHRREKNVLCRVAAPVRLQAPAAKRKHDEREAMIGMLLPYYGAAEIAEWADMPLDVVEKYERMLGSGGAEHVKVKQRKEGKSGFRKILESPYISCTFKKNLLHSYTRKKKDRYNAKGIRG